MEGNPAKFSGTDAERHAWIEKDEYLRGQAEAPAAPTTAMQGNRGRYPFSGTDAERHAWIEKDYALSNAAKVPPTQTPPTPVAPTAKDPLELPTPPPPLGPYPWNGTDDDRLLWLQRCSVACHREGITQYDQAIHYKWLLITQAAREHDIAEAMDENRKLLAKLHHLERHGIDLLADTVHEATKDFIAGEVARQVAALEGRVTKAGVDSRSEVSEIERLHATTVLLRGRVADLEMLNPIWVTKFITGGAG